MIKDTRRVSSAVLYTKDSILITIEQAIHSHGYLVRIYNSGGYYPYKRHPVLPVLVSNDRGLFNYLQAYECEVCSFIHTNS